MQSSMAETIWQAYSSCGYSKVAMTQKAGTKLTFKKAWTFPEAVEKKISKFLQENPGLWLHAPVGISKIAKGIFNKQVRMITLDKDVTLRPDIVADVFHLPFRFGVFTGAISDPIWYTLDKKKTIGLSYPSRRYLSYSIRDVLKPGGHWLFNGLWNPIVKGLKIIKVLIPMQEFSSFRNLSLLVYLRKVNKVL